MALSAAEAILQATKMISTKRSNSTNHCMIKLALGYPVITKNSKSVTKKNVSWFSFNYVSWFSFNYVQLNSGKFTLHFKEVYHD